VSALGDAIETLTTPHAYAAQVAGYITCDKTVAMHVNRRFSTNMTARRVAEIRRERCIGKTRHEKMMEAAEPLPSDVWLNRRAARVANEAFVKALGVAR
jgi:hypothetical protein